MSGKLRVYSIDIETQMKGGLVLRVEVLYALPHDLPNPEFIHVVHRITFHSVLAEGDVLIIVDVPDGNQDHIFWREIGERGQPLPFGEVREGGHPRHMRQRHPVILITQRGIRPKTVIYAVGMSIHPDDF